MQLKSGGFSCVNFEGRAGNSKNEEAEERGTIGNQKSFRRKEALTRVRA